MQRILLSLLLVAAIATTGQAQQKHFTIGEATLGLYTNLAPANIHQLHWLPGQDALVSVYANGKGGALIKQQVPGGQVDTLLRLPELNRLVTGKAMLLTFPELDWIDGTSCLFQSGNKYFILSFNGGAWAANLWCTLPDEADNVQVDKATRQLAYTVRNNLFLVNANGAATAITNDADSNIVNGHTVHREEFGIDKGIFFSPKADYVAFYRMDQTMVENYPIINWDDVPATVHYTKYPFAGRTSHEVTLGVYSPATKQTVFLQTGTPKDHYLTGVTWSPDEKSIYIGLLNREQNHLWLNQYDAQTGAFVKTLFEETDPKYVHPMHGLTFLPGSNEQFLWFSERDGFTHLYRYNTSGQLLNQVTKGDWVVNDIVSLNAKTKTVYITAAKESPMEKHGYAVNWEKGTIIRLDSDPGTHTPDISTDGNYFTDRWSNEQTPPTYDVVAVNKKWKKNLLTSPDPLAGYERPKIEDVTLRADDGTPLYGKLVYPTGFNPAKKYPVIVYLYNGPGIQLLSNSFPASGNLWYEYMAQRGYVVFTMDGRGSSNRGLRFEQATFRQLGTVELEDQMKGVNYLRALPFVDSTHMGIHGWSFGGFMTTSFMLRKPGVFACAVAGGPVMDWRMYEVMYTERYMDTPQENPDGYENANLLDKVGNLKGHLLLIHGTVDSTVVWQHSIRFLKASVAQHVQVDYYVYPGHEHNVRGFDRVHLMQKVSDYFDLYLKKEKE